MGKIGQNPKIGQLWRPVAPQPYVVQKKLTSPRKLPGVNSISLQCIPWPVACSEWDACLTPSKCGVLGQMTLEWKVFVNICLKSAFQPRFTCRGNLAKIGRCEVAEKSSPLLTKKTPASGTLLSYLFPPHLTDRAQNFVNVVGPWPVHVYWLWSRSASVCRTYSGKSPKSEYNIGFQPTKNTASLLRACYVTIGSEMKKWRTYISSTSEITASYSIANCNFNLTLTRCRN